VDRHRGGVLREEAESSPRKIAEFVGQKSRVGAKEAAVTDLEALDCHAQFRPED